MVICYHDIELNLADHHCLRYSVNWFLCKCRIT